MKRRAIIIECSSVPGQDTIPGCALDAAAWKRYLMSPVGGAWYEFEIETLSNPSAAFALSRVRQLSADYGFVAFSGHGHVHKLTDQTMACFAGGDLSDDQLTPSSDRATLIMDCCRGVIRETLAMATAVLREAVTDTRVYRERFDEALSVAEKGVCTIYGCAFEQAANEDKNGGAFTQNLIKAGTSWKAPGALTLRQAFDLAAVRIRERTPQQTPEAFLGRRLNHFPFAVNP